MGCEGVCHAQFVLLNPNPGETLNPDGTATITCDTRPGFHFCKLRAIEAIYKNNYTGDPNQCINLANATDISGQI